jgi:type I restriction enzyme S subunit
MSDWKEVKFSEFVQINPKVEIAKDSKAFYVEMKDMKPRRKYSYPARKRTLKGGSRFVQSDTLFARISPCLEQGNINQVNGLGDESGWGSTEFLVFRAMDNISDSDYITYLSKSDLVKEYAANNLQGSSGRQRVSKDVFDKLEVFLPPLPEQKAIAEVLSNLDDKIDLLHRQNKTLEEMAEVLFRQWFIEEAGEDWEEGKLGYIVTFNPVCRISKGVSAPYLEMKNVCSSSFKPENWYYRNFTSGMKFQNGDTIIARISPCLENGKSSYISFLEDGQIGWGSTEYIVMRMKKPYHPFTSYLIGKDKDFRDFAIGTMQGSSGRQRAQANSIREFDILIPPSAVIDKLNKQFESIAQKLQYNAKQISVLEQLRDTLLPKLISGEVSVEIGRENNK